MDSHCSVNEACCSGMCQYGSDCLDKSCSKKFDCSVGQSCCSNVCEDGYDCSGHLCSSSNDCSVGQDCCDGICDYCVDQTPVVVGAIVASLGAFFPLMMFIYCCNRRARLGRPGRVVLGRLVTITVATKTHLAIHASPQVYKVISKVTPINPYLKNMISIRKLIHLHTVAEGVFKTRNGEMTKWRNDEMAKWN